MKKLKRLFVSISCMCMFMCTTAFSSISEYPVLVPMNGEADGLVELQELPGIQNISVEATPTTGDDIIAQDSGVDLSPTQYISFVFPGTSSGYALSVTNTGSEGSDTYDLSVDSIWPVSFYTLDLTSALADTDGDGIVDTGTIAQGDTITFAAVMTPPSDVAIGDTVTTQIKVQSSQNSEVSVTSTWQAIVPTRFAQAIGNDGKTDLQLTSSTQFSNYPGGTGGNARIATGINENYIVVDQVTDGDSNQYIELTIYNHSGRVITGPTRLNTPPGLSSYSEEIVEIASTPDGNIGILWGRFDYSTSDNMDEDFFLTILNSNGELVSGPTNLTTTDLYSTTATTVYFSFDLCATSDNRLMVAWKKSEDDTRELNYRIFNSTGQSVFNPAQITSVSFSEHEDIGRISISNVNGTQAIFNWISTHPLQSEVNYVVLGSAGSVVKSISSLGFDVETYIVDAVQTLNGNIVIAGPNKNISTGTIFLYTILDSSFNPVVSWQSLMNSSLTTERLDNFSMATDASGRVMMVARDKNMGYYSLLGANGLSILTQPIVYGYISSYFTPFNLARNFVFADVSSEGGKAWIAPWVENFYNKGITTGCGADPLRYCPDDPVTRSQMAIFILRTLNGKSYSPPTQSNNFVDVPISGQEWTTNWVNQFYSTGITTGCGMSSGLLFCPDRAVTRAEMAVFLLRAKYGKDYTPPAATGIFADVPVAGQEWAQPWIEQFYREGITTGCGADPLRFCPTQTVTRAQMAIFIGRAFGTTP